MRASIHRVDPINTELRRSITVRRRVYYATGPNAIWHMDGHHQLIKWRFVTHGGIDGYSRAVVFLRCSDNNRASTVLSLFGPFDRKWVIGVISGNLDVYAPNCTLVFNTSLAKNAY